MEETPQGLRLCLISVHGLIRGRDLELGRDPDTGGQTRYVVEVARALGRHDGVEHVDLITRRIADPELDTDYSAPFEGLTERARIVRLDCGDPAEYLAKEALWDHLDELVDNTLIYLREQPRLPDLLHSHYADAGYVGSRLSHVLGIPLVHTGHSLGRVKQRRLLAAGLRRSEIEATYNIERRIQAEETTLATAEMVITSTQQEVEEQYGLYDFYQPERMRVIPPGTDLSRFSPPDGSELRAGIVPDIRRFLDDPDKPMVLVFARPDPRKNLPAHVEAFAEDPALREMANLVVVAGVRDDIEDLPEGAREVVTELLLTIDRHDLYGSVAYPKGVPGQEVPSLYRLAARTRGVHVNAALTEPFGLTLIEAAASGLPIVATSDGGPRDIIRNCHSGVLVDPLDPASIAAGIRETLSDPARWDTLSANGREGAERHYSWAAHASTFLELAREVTAPVEAAPPSTRPPRRASVTDRAVFTDIDQNLLGAPEALPELVRALRAHRRQCVFGIATGRRLDAALRALRKLEVPEPDILITSGGTRIHYAPSLNEDLSWVHHIDHHWMPGTIHRILADVPGLERQPKTHQSRHKLSYYYDPDVAPSPADVNALLFRRELAVNVSVSFGQYLDILPIRASKGLALRYAMTNWDIALDHVLVAGGSGADEDMLRGNPMAVIVANRHHEELSGLEELENIYLASKPFAWGILEAFEHYEFFDG